MNPKAVAGIVIAVIALVITSFVVLVFSERVEEGKVSVVYTPSKGADRVLEAGWHFLEIGLFEDTQEYPTRITIVKDNLTVTTSDGKKVTMPVRYEMKVDKSKVIQIFKELGSQNIENIQEGYLYQKLFKVAREVVSGYSVIDIYGTKTSEASAKLTEKFAEDVEHLGFIISDVTLGTPELDEGTQKAIDARVQAAQQLEGIILEKQIAAETAAKALIEAQGISEAQIEKARGEAEANRLLQQSITPELIQLKEMEARLKHGWITVKTGSAIVDTE